MHSSPRTLTTLDDLKRHVFEVRTVFGPAWLVMMADVDAASVITAIQSGASYKYGLVLILLALIVPLYFIMEVAGRVGAATKKGLGELVRDNFSRRLSLIITLPMAITDFLSYVAEYAAMAVGLKIVGIPPIVSLPLIYAVHILVVFKQEYEKAEKSLLAVSLVLLLAYIIFMARGMSLPYHSLIPSKVDKDFLFLVGCVDFRSHRSRRRDGTLGSEQSPHGHTCTRNLRQDSVLGERRRRHILWTPRICMTRGRQSFISSLILCVLWLMRSILCKE